MTTDHVRGLVPLLDTIDLPKPVGAAIRRAVKSEEDMRAAGVAVSEARKTLDSAMLGKHDLLPSQAQDALAKSLKAQDAATDANRQAVKAALGAFTERRNSLMDNARDNYEQAAKDALKAADNAAAALQRAGNYGAVYRWLYLSKVREYALDGTGPGRAQGTALDVDALAAALHEASPERTASRLAEADSEREQRRAEEQQSRRAWSQALGGAA